MITLQDFTDFIDCARRHPGDPNDSRSMYWSLACVYPGGPPVNQRAERLIRNSRADIHFSGMHALTQIDANRICMPDRGRFSKSGMLYAVTFHELAHWAGSRIHQGWMIRTCSSIPAILSRMSRNGDYAPEELIATATSYFVNERLGTLDDDAQYQTLQYGYKSINGETFAQDDVIVRALYEMTKDRVEYLLGFDEMAQFEGVGDQLRDIRHHATMFHVKQSGPVLTPQKVDDLLGKVLTGDENSGVRWSGVINDYQLNQEKAEQYRGEIQAMLGELNETFFDDVGGGWSFLNLCNDRHGNLWTGVHQTCERLLALGAALGVVSFPLPRELWPALPGNMPYVTIERSKFR